MSEYLWIWIYIPAFNVIIVVNMFLVIKLTAGRSKIALLGHIPCFLVLKKVLREGAKNILGGGGCAKSAAFGRQMRTPPIFKYLLCKTSTNEYPNIFMRQKVARTNIRIYSAGKNKTNIFDYEYIQNKIFEYIRISEYSLYTESVWLYNIGIGSGMEQSPRIGKKHPYILVSV